MPPVELLVPSSEPELFEALGDGTDGEVAVLAGGTDLLFDLEEGRLRPRRLVSLRRLPWGTHAWGDGGLTIGATEPLRRLEADPRLAEEHPALAAAIARVGTPSLRGQATVGGNLGRSAPASDLTPALLALDAEVELLGRGGSRRLPLDRFLRASRAPELRAGELVRAVRLPEARPRSGYLCQRVRPANDISQIAVAVACSPSDRRWRVALGGVPPRPTLVEAAAAALTGPEPSEEDRREAGRRLAAEPSLVSDRRATEEYRRQLAAVLCERALASALRPHEGGL